MSEAYEVNSKAGRKVSRTEIMSNQDYAKIRDGFRQKVLAQKEDRRIHVGEHLTFLFENHDTVHYQIQEMLRVENTTGEKEIQHELTTYNELIGTKGTLGCTLLIEIADPIERDNLLKQWLNLPQHIYLKTQSGSRIKPIFDQKQIGETRISSVHYIHFELGDQVPVSIHCDHKGINAETKLNPNQIAALCKDLMAR